MSLRKQSTCLLSGREAAGGAPEGSRTRRGQAHGSEGRFLPSESRDVPCATALQEDSRLPGSQTPVLGGSGEGQVHPQRHTVATFPTSTAESHSPDRGMGVPGNVPDQRLGELPAPPLKPRRPNKTSAVTHHDGALPTNLLPHNGGSPPFFPFTTQASGQEQVVEEK